MKSLIANMPYSHRHLVEILVLNNKSEDDTFSKLSSLNSEMLKVHSNPSFFRTSEENIASGIPLARGEFVWLLGDDDIPRYRTFYKLLTLLESTDKDLFVFNCRIRDELGRVRTMSQIRGISKDADISLIDLIKRVGMINMLAGFSVVVARRASLDQQVAQRIIDVSPIYAHCFWFLASFVNGKVRLMSEPLVDYRVFFQSRGWSTFTEENGVGHFYYWHLGLIRLFKWSVERGLLSPLDIAEIFEFRGDGTRYRHVDEIVHKLIEQTDYFIKTGDDRNLISKDNFQESFSFLIEIDVGLQDILFEIGNLLEPFWALDEADVADIAGLVRNYPERRLAAMNLLISRSADLFGPYLVKVASGYNIYNVSEHWIGVRYDCAHLTEGVLTQFEPRSMHPGIIVEESEASLLDAIGRVPPLPERLHLAPFAEGEWPEPLRTAFSSEEIAALRREAEQLSAEQFRIIRPVCEVATLTDGSSSRIGRPPRPRRRAVLLWQPLGAYRKLAQPVRTVLGWSAPEPLGTWSLSDGAVLSVELPPRTSAIKVTVVAYGPPGQTRSIKLRVAGLGEQIVALAHYEVATIKFDTRKAPSRFSMFIAHEPAGSARDGYGMPDDRALGIFLKHVIAEVDDRVDASRAISGSVAQEVWLPEWFAGDVDMPVRLRSGWSQPEAEGVWSVGPVSILLIDPPRGASTIVMKLRAFAEPGAMRTFTVSASGTTQTFSVVHDEEIVIDVPISPIDPAAVILLKLNACPSPSELGQSDDDRPLGLLLRSVEVR